MIGQYNNFTLFPQNDETRQQLLDCSQNDVNEATVQQALFLKH